MKPNVPLRRRLKQLDGSSTWLAYVSAVALVALATVLRLALDRFLGPFAAPFPTYFLAVAVAARFLGLGPSILTILLSAFFVNLLFLPPRYGISMSPGHLFATGIFLIAGFVVLALARSMRKGAKALAWERNILQSVMKGALRSHLVYLDRDFNFVKVNETYAKSCGYKPEEMIGKNHFALYPHAENEAIFARVRDTGQMVEFHDKPFQYPDQPERGVTYWDWTLSPVKDAAGQVIGFVLALVETTERKRAEEALWESEERFRRYFELGLIGMAITSPTKGWLEVNEELCAILGYDRSELVKKTWAELTHPDDLAADVAHFNRIVAGEIDGYTLDKRFLRKDGQVVYTTLSARCLRRADNSVNYFVVLLQDITERKRAEEALRKSEERFRLCFDLSAAGSTEVDSKTSRFLQVNQKFCDITGYSRQELQSMTFSDVTHPGDRTKHQEVHNKLLRGEVQNYNLEKRYVRKDGRIIWAHLAVALVRDAAGNPLWCIGTMVDVTEQKRAEEALAGAKEQLQHYADNLEKVVEERTAKLQETVNDLEHFSYTITHDMRAPLRAMQNFTHLMLEGECAECLKDISRSYLGRIRVAARRMDSLITDALQYSRMLRNEFPLQPVDVAPLLRSLIETYPNLQAPKVQIRIEGGFPLVLGNEAGLTQCFSNLLGNAVKFVDSGKTPQVRVWAEKRNNGFVRVWVEDNGIGIAKEYQERIWGMFETLESTDSGTGIGLALVRKVVERMGGRTGVESEPGQGSRFWVELKAGG